MTVTPAGAAARRARPLFYWLIVAAVLAAFYAFDIFLASVQRTELASEANSLYQQAQRLASTGRGGEAIRSYRRALAIDRNNTEYQLALARALAAAKQYQEALPLFDDVLDRYPDDGRANLGVARLKEATGDTDKAASYFHRSIYGSWPRDAQARRIQVRLELCDMLARAGRQRELLAELLPVEDEAPNDPSLRLRIASLFITAGSPARAADAYRAILRQNPDDGQAYAGLGEAELQLADYRDAQAAFMSALRHNPDASVVRQRLALATQLAQLDPTPRRLPFQERLARSRKILTLAIAQLEQCAAGQDNAEVAGLANRAQTAVRPKRRREEDPVETNLSIAEDTWNYVRRTCPAQPSAADPLTVVMSRLERRP